MRFLGHFTFIALIILSIASESFACPEIKKLVDFNCDSQIKVVAIGDSIVRGRGDLVNENNGGWIKRVGQFFSIGRAVNLGTPGITTTRLYADLAKAFSKKNTLFKKINDADVVIVSVGINDFFEDRDPSLTTRNIKRIVALIRTRLQILNRSKPYVVVAKITPTTREFQAPFVEDVNRILARYRSNALPSYLRLDTLDPELISYDGIHPIAEGYDQLAQITEDFLLNDANTQMRNARPDSDKDGVYDLFETIKFGTDTSLKDTDGDGLSDKEEIFKYKTNPLLSDTDTDGVSDAQEITNATNPLDASSF